MLFRMEKQNRVNNSNSKIKSGKKQEDLIKI